jgi:preprotein translocase subunit Sec63
MERLGIEGTVRPLAVYNTHEIMLVEGWIIINHEIRNIHAKTLRRKGFNAYNFNFLGALR